MKFVIQRVLESSVAVDGEVCGRIGRGLLVLVGIGREDNEEIADKFVRKLLGLRIFADADGKTNLSLADVDGELLLVSQFTLYADCRRGNRPSFTEAGEPQRAEELYNYIVDACRRTVPVVETGRYGADMKVSLVNDGPFTILLDERLLGPRRG
ncbi:MAG: D-aminoacyl-tRNA deacylase [Anaerovoracaceae bacterium]|jgi:D-tyrosyl-tRNA(Tyr) deacylase